MTVAPPSPAQVSLDGQETLSPFITTMRNYLRSAALGMEITEYGTPFLPEKRVLDHAVTVLRQQITSLLPSHDLFTGITLQAKSPESKNAARVELRVWDNRADQVHEAQNSPRIVSSDFCVYEYAQRLLQGAGQQEDADEIERRFFAWRAQQHCRMYVAPYIVRAIENSRIEAAQIDPTHFLVASSDGWEQLLYTKATEVTNDVPDEWPRRLAGRLDETDRSVYYTCGILLGSRGGDQYLSSEDLVQLEALAIQFQLSWSWAHIAATNRKQQEKALKQRDLDLELTTRKGAFEMLKDIAKDLRALEQATSRVKGIVYPLEGELLTRYRRTGELIPPDWAVPIYGWKFQHRWASEKIIQGLWIDFRAQLSCLLLHFWDPVCLPQQTDTWDLERKPWELLADVDRQALNVDDILLETVEWVVNDQRDAVGRNAVWCFEFLKGCFYEPFKARQRTDATQPSSVSLDEEGVPRLTGALVLMWAHQNRFAAQRVVTSQLFRATKRHGWVRLEVLPALDSLIDDIRADGVNHDGTHRRGNKSLEVTLELDASAGVWLKLQKLSQDFLVRARELITQHRDEDIRESSIRVGSLETQMATIVRFCRGVEVTDSSLEVCLGKLPDQGIAR